MRLKLRCLLALWLLPSAALAALRPLATDRPDQTESPFTVDAGHAQLESDLMVYTQQTEQGGGADLRTREWSWATINLRYGLSPRTELQLMAEPHVRIATEDRASGLTSWWAGEGDVTTRFKVNFWGDDGGATALGLLPWVKWPLAANGIRNGKTEFGLILPFATILGDGWGLGAQVELARVRNDALEPVTRFMTSYSFDHDLTERLGGYLELVLQTEGRQAPWVVQFDCGLTYAVGANLQFDAGCNIGVSAAAPDFQPFAGVSRRF